MARPSRQRWNRSWSELASYLDGLGFDALYLRPATTVRDDAPRPRRAAPSPEEPPRRPAPPRAAPPPADPVPPEPASPEPASPEPPSPEPGAPAPERAAKLEDLRRESLLCTRCGLCERRRSVVFGAGHADADLMFVGEGPGAEEDRQGLPFVGPAGELLTRIIEAIDLRREEVYIANVVKCRPPGNRDPQPDEVAACRPYLDAQIDLVRPKVLVALGRVAAQALLGTDDALGRLRGRWHRVRGVDTRATYHPAALLRNAGFKRPTWEDMKVVRARLEELGGGRG